MKPYAKLKVNKIKNSNMYSLTSNEPREEEERYDTSHERTVEVFEEEYTKG